MRYGLLGLFDVETQMLFEMLNQHMDTTRERYKNLHIGTTSMNP